MFYDAESDFPITVVFILKRDALGLELVEPRTWFLFVGIESWRILSTVEMA